MGRAGRVRALDHFSWENIAVGVRTTDTRPSVSQRSPRFQNDLLLAHDTGHFPLAELDLYWGLKGQKGLNLGRIAPSTP